MKTAKEMRACAQKYLPDKLFSANPDKISFELIEEALYKDEDVVLAFVAHAGSIANYGIYQIGVAITNKRLLIVYKPNSMASLFVRPNCKTYNLKEINSVGPQGISLEISIRAEGNILLGNWSSERRNLLSNKIREIVDAYQNENSSFHTGQPSVSVELKQFYDLLEKGVITQEEFDAKKKQLLNL